MPILAATIVAAVLAGPPPSAADTPAAAFERLKALAGTWQIATGSPEGEAATVSYRLTAQGSALIETLFQGTPHEMTTVYYLDAGNLVLTHYCASGNQPHMRLDPKASTKDTLKFVFAGGSNIDPARDEHMHDVTIRFHADGTADSEWTGWAQGKPGHVARLYLKKRSA